MAAAVAVAAGAAPEDDDDEAAAVVAGVTVDAATPLGKAVASDRQTMTDLPTTAR